MLLRPFSGVLGVNFGRFGVIFQSKFLTVGCLRGFWGHFRGFWAYLDVFCQFWGGVGVESDALRAIFRVNSGHFGVISKDSGPFWQILMLLRPFLFVLGSIRHFEAVLDIFEGVWVPILPILDVLRGLWGHFSDFWANMVHFHHFTGFWPFFPIWTCARPFWGEGVLRSF